MTDKMRQSSILDKIDLAAGVEQEYLRPNSNEDMFVFIDRALEELQNIWEDTNGQSEIDRGVPQIEELAKQGKGSDSMSLGQQDLQNYRQLLWRLEIKVTARCVSIYQRVAKPQDLSLLTPMQSKACKL